ncbi:integral membrane sensor signal transduction histidine kinase [Desulfovibrio sp. X2]|uniref:sensor histidine kinase n=1 Tax=Desulfovibrio sp. X2 TaxID=941449 RepID=UPI0003587097|nr:PAS domain-containing sensor histidine kinase [Desulfovibrio sp. X2]EPR37451.1 integral membrane sensor signal transduction histidine kinase [Desulfovibrio sp. X2]
MTQEIKAPQGGRALAGEVDAVVSPTRYGVLRRRIVLLMVVVSVVPLLAMTMINLQQYHATLDREVQAPLRAMLNKTKNSFELFLAERTSTVSFIAAAYSFQDLANDRNLNRIFQVMKDKFEGFVDLGLIGSGGVQVTYAGPYSLKGRDYTDQPWFNEVQFKGRYISDIFLGFRKFPHFIVAVQHLADDGTSWVLRATIDTGQFDRLIASMGLEPEADAFLVNRSGVLQTVSKFYGKVLDPLPFDMPPQSLEPTVRTMTDPSGRSLFLAYVYIPDTDYVLMVVKPRSDIMRTWHSLRTDMAVVFVIGVILILAVAYRITASLVERLRESDERRELAFRQVEHSQKLSSIGRLAAGVAHEVNNPLAIINEKAGLMQDILAMRKDYPDRERFLGLIDAIIKAVGRCRTITHRMLGFARQMDVAIETLDVNEIIRETASFLEREASYRNVVLGLHLGENLPHIASDRGQLQQVFLNILNNAFAAVNEGGAISVTTWEKDIETVGVSIKDDGCGMSEETQRHIFEPFFTTKKGSGTGLGLSITYGIVKRLGGDISVLSKVGQGTTFTLFLPKTPPEGARI